MRASHSDSGAVGEVLVGQKKKSLVLEKIISNGEFALPVWIFSWNTVCCFGCGGVWIRWC